jgi:hypothetical protein
MTLTYTMTTADEALQAAFEAGALTLCPEHKYNIIRATPDPNVRLKAYEIAAAKIERGLFTSERFQLVLAISSMIELAEEECRCCANTRAYQALRAVACDARKSCPCSQPTCPTYGYSRIAGVAA